VAESESELFKSLDRVLEESRKIRAESVPLLEQAQWPLVEPSKPVKEEVRLPTSDVLRVPCPPLLGFQRDKGNLPSSQPAQSPKPDRVSLAGPVASPNETKGTLSGEGILELAGLPEVPVLSP